MFSVKISERVHAVLSSVSSGGLARNDRIGYVSRSGFHARCPILYRQSLPLLGGFLSALLVGIEIPPLVEGRHF